MAEMNFDNIALLSDEEKLLREMEKGKPIEKGTKGIDNLRGYELVKYNGESQQYTIDNPGNGYIRYLDKKKEIQKQSNKKFWISVIVSIVAVAISIISFFKR